MKSIYSKIIKLNKVEKIYMLILLSPLLDIFTSLGINEKVPLVGNFGLIFRGVFLIIMVLSVFYYKTYNRKKYIYFLGIIAIYYLLFNVAHIFLDFDFIFEFKAFIKAFYLPILFICMLNYFDYFANKDKVNYKKIFNVLCATALLYVVLIVVPAFLGIGYNSYASGKRGIVGYFNSPNEVGTILAILSPIVLWKVSDIKNKFLGILITILFIYGSALIGTKTPILGILISIIMASLFIVISFVKGKDKKILKKIFYPLSWLALVLFALFTFSPLFSNFTWQSNLFDNKNLPVVGQDSTSKPIMDDSLNNGNSSIKDNIGDSSKDDKNLPTNNEGSIKKENIIVRKIKNMIFSSRDIYVEEGLNVFEQGTITEKIFGLGSGKVKTGHKNTVEIDLFDILFNYGILGFTLYFGILFFGLYVVIKQMITLYIQGTSDFMFESAFSGIIIGFLIAFTAGHTMLAPAVSIYIAILLSFCFSKTNYLSTNKKKCSTLTKLYQFLTRHKKIIAIVLCLLLLCIVSYNINYTRLNGMMKLTSEGIYFYTQNSSNSKNYKLDNFVQKNGFDIEDKIYTYKHTNDDVNLVFTRRLFDNGSIGNYITINNNSEKNIYFKLKLPKLTPEYTFNFFDREIVKDYSTTVGYDKIALPIKYLENKNMSLLIGKSYNYKLVLKKYDEDNYSTYKNLISENNDLKENSFGLYKEIMVPPHTFIDTYYYEHNDKVFNSEENYDGKKLKKIDKLIKSKIKYLKSIDYNISDFTIKLMKEVDYIE